jgi:hypothetical protein
MKGAGVVPTHCSMFLGALAVGLVDEIYRVLHSARRSQSCTRI